VLWGGHTGGMALEVPLSALVGYAPFCMRRALVPRSVCSPVEIYFLEDQCCRTRASDERENAFGIFYQNHMDFHFHESALAHPWDDIHEDVVVPKSAISDQLVFVCDVV